MKQILIVLFAVAFVAFVEAKPGDVFDKDADNIRSAGTAVADTAKAGYDATKKTAGDAVDGVKNAGKAISDTTGTYYNATKDRLNNRNRRDVLDDDAEAARKAGTKVADKAKAGYDATKKTVGDAGRAIGESVGEHYDATKDRLNNRNVRDVLDDDAEAARKAGTKVADKAKAGYDATKKTVGDAGRAIGESVGEHYDATKDRLNNRNVRGADDDAEKARKAAAAVADKAKAGSDAVKKTAGDVADGVKNA